MQSATRLRLLLVVRVLVVGNDDGWKERFGWVLLWSRGRLRLFIFRCLHSWPLFGRLVNGPGIAGARHQLLVGDLWSRWYDDDSLAVVQQQIVNVIDVRTGVRRDPGAVAFVLILVTGGN